FCFVLRYAATTPRSSPLVGPTPMILLGQHACTETSTMNPCPQCGAIPQPSDKFCNICGTPVVMGPPGGFGGQPQMGGFGAPPPQQGGGFGAPPPAAYGAPPGPAGPPRCQMGHDIAPGASYCPHGHPIALDAMPFANDQYGGGGYGQQMPPQQGGFGQPPPQQ